ncbi:MAG: hypothetical protein Q9187_000475 [Circinaria calcarea]
MESIRNSKAFLLAGVVTLFYLICRLIYRLYLSPHAKIPGLKLAASMDWYERYYDLVLKARFPWKIKELHETYGSIIRIRPYEVHINDPAFGDTFFGSGTERMDKYAGHHDQFGMPESTFNTIDHDLHKLRRGAIGPYFSRRSIIALELMLQEKIEKFCSRLEGFRTSGEPVDLRLLFSCFTTDVITEYAFPHSFDLLDTPDLAPAWRETFSTGLRNFHWFKHFPFLWKVLRSIPDNLMFKLAPEMKLTIDWERGNQRLIRQIMDTYDPNDKKASHPTIFHEILGSDLPPQEKSYERLWQEGESMIGGGVETIANTLNVIMFNLLTHPEQLACVKQELHTAMPTLGSPPSWSLLEGLPYLSAVISEGLRTAMGVTSRFIHVAPNRDLVYNAWVIPVGTAVFMSIMLLHHNPQVFPKPYAFLPERWLNGDLSRSDLFQFGKGPRMCGGLK